MGRAKKHQTKASNKNNSKRLRKKLKKTQKKKNLSERTISNLNQSILNTHITQKLTSTPNTIQLVKSYAPTIIKEEVKEKQCPDPKKRSRYSKQFTIVTEDKESFLITLFPDDIIFCGDMIEKHGDNYKAMARDEKNVRKFPPKVIRKLIRGYKRTNEKYKVYITGKQAQEECFSMLQNLNIVSSSGRDEGTMASSMDT